MAPIAAVVVIAIGAVITTIAKANALKSEAAARQVEGDQELLSQKRQLRQELGFSAAAVGASGLLGGSFANVFESQAIEDANFLGIIKQRTDFDVASLKQQATVTLVTGLIGAAGKALGGVAGAKGQGAEVDFAKGTARARSLERDRLRSTTGGNVFSTGRKAGLLAPRRGSTAFFI